MLQPWARSQRAATSVQGDHQILQSSLVDGLWQALHHVQHLNGSAIDLQDAYHALQQLSHTAINQQEDGQKANDDADLKLMLKTLSGPGDELNKDCPTSDIANCPALPGLNINGLGWLLGNL